MPSLRASRLLLVIPFVAFLAGCAPGSLAPEQSGSSAPSASASASGAATPNGSGTPSDSGAPSDSSTPSPVPTAEPIAGGTELELSCEQIFTLDQLYAFNENYLYVAQTTIAMPTVMERAPELKGLVCAAKHESNDDTLFIGVAEPNAAAREELADVPAFETDGELGVASSLGDTYWVTVASQDFTSAADAQQTLDEVAANLG